MIENTAKETMKIAANYMDDELREQLHEALAPCGEEEFLAAYSVAHYEKIGEVWEFSKENPCF